jgi:16S rRNA (guanine527-N7)-methyltransferase
MVDANIIFKYFPDLTAEQRSKFEKLYPVYKEWNDKINVISRKDIDELYVKHVLHSLAIARFVDFKNCHEVLDIGTGGGFPGIPLAILFPHIQFHLVDSIGKKINVVSAVAEALQLDNVKAEHSRAEQIKGKYDIIMCRAVTRLLDFYGWIHKNRKPDTEIICLKGGDLVDEIFEFKQKNKQRKVKVHDISDVIDLPFFETKKVLVIQ